MPLSAGQILNNRYRIVRLLGQGGFGAVYRAWDMNLEKPCALKENLDTSSDAQRQFKHEARILSDLSHPNLPRVIDHFIIAGQGQYLVMDYVEGEDLGERLSRAGGPLPADLVLPWISQVCEALAYLHSRQPPVIHRDIKPANIKITPDPEQPAGRAMLVDFGIAKVYDPALRTTLGARAVTPGYSPNEQYLSQGRTDARTDIYALGATLYTLLTGQTPPEAPERNMGLALVAPRALNPSVTPQVETAVLKALEMLPEHRQQSAVEMKAAISFQRSADSGQKPAAPVVQTLPAPGQAHPSLGSNLKSSIQNQKSQILNLKWPWLLAGLALVGVLAAWGVVSVLQNIIDSKATATVPGAALATTRAPISPTPRIASDTPAPLPTFTTTPTETLTPARTQTPTPTGLPEELVDGKGVKMRLVPVGEFTMGGSADTALAECKKLYIGGSCDRSWFTDEEPLHQVYLATYYIDRTEVTNASFAQCEAEGACSAPKSTGSSTRSSYYGNPDFSDYPVIYVDWEQAKAYCEWRGADLPTEAQWEKAARGTDGRLYPWGNSFDGTKANFCDQNCSNSWANKSWDDGYADTAPVGNYPTGASMYGVLDMAGNVWEWVRDWYNATYYSSQSSWSDPLGPDSGDDRVVRSGGWSYHGGSLLAADRGRDAPSSRNDALSFRCSRSQ